MSETSAQSNPYRVSYTDFVRNGLANLIARAKERGLEAQVRAATRDIDYRLHIFPQFGDPVIDLSLASSQMRIGTVAPLVVKYALYEDLRLVIVSIPIATLPHSGL
ncbi:MAG TPA: hypothetical protein VE999_23100 [Gemmataceae bacterium]|nr:hypothetical protein [Gemmataceae bacterium]